MPSDVFLTGAGLRNDDFPDGCEVDEQRGTEPVRSLSRFGRVSSYSGCSLLSFLPFSFTCLYFDLWLLDTNIDVIVMATEARPPRARTRRINCVCIFYFFFTPDMCLARAASGPSVVGVILHIQRSGNTTPRFPQGLCICKTGPLSLKKKKKIKSSDWEEGEKKTVNFRRNTFGFTAIQSFAGEKIETAE